jgi:hypothetical protein
MKKTIVMWNTEKPTFEEIKDKSIYVAWGKSPMCGVGFNFTSICSRHFYDAYFLDDFIAYAVLEEETYCEWEEIAEGENKNYYRSQCQKNVDGIEGCNRLWLPIQGKENFCPHCGLPIRIVAEPEAMEYEGVNPTVSQMDGEDNWHVGWQNNKFNKTCSFHFYGKTRTEVIEAWNNFVKKMKGG